MRASLSRYLFIAAGLATQAAAHADDKLACVQAADAGQAHRSAGRLKEARASLHACARTTCPALVRSDCTQWLSEVEASMPTIVLRAVSARGEDMTDVRVDIDGRRFAEKLEGLPLEVDPGPHVFTGRTAAGTLTPQEIVVRTAEKNRTVTLRVEAGQPAPTPETSPESSATFRPGAAPWILAGVAVAGVTSFAYFGLRGRAEVADMRNDCAGHCPSSLVDAAHQKLLAADISLGVALVSAGIATYLFWRAATPAAKSVAAREVTVMPLTGGMAAVWLEHF
jgi:hypothetical protein